MQKAIYWTSFLLIALFIFSCSKSKNPVTPPSSNNADPSYATDIQPIFTAHCVSCHSASFKNGGLDLSAGSSYAHLVNVTASKDINKKRVLPQDPDNSYLVIKLEGAQAGVTRMPLNGSKLSSSNIQSVKNWITRGAKNN
jgi:mono/diheme cytochrome c family protein